MTAYRPEDKTLRQVWLRPEDDVVLDRAVERLGLTATDTQRWILRHLVRPWLEGHIDAEGP